MLTNPYQQVKFLKSAARVNQLPTDSGYEVAFAGRSNAGKSSALNCLTGIKNLARTSKTPGRTQLMNVFSIDEQRRLIDLPGYGYAKVSQAQKHNWQIHLAHYLEVRESLRGLILIMDIRHPSKELDVSMINWALNRDLPIHVVLTKADKLSRSETKNTLLKVQKSYELMQHLLTVQTFSSLKKEGVDELVALLNAWFDISSIKS